MKNVSTVLLDYVYAVIYLYRGERLCNIMHYLKVQRTILGVANGTSKNVGLGKFWQDLEISEAFLIKSRSLVFAWFVLTFFESRNFLPKSLGLGFLTRISASR